MISILSKSYHIYIIVIFSIFCLKLVFYFALKSVYKPVFYEYKTLPPYVKKIPLNMISRFFQNKNSKLDQKTKQQNKKRNKRFEIYMKKVWFYKANMFLLIFLFRVHQEYKALKLSDLRIIATLGVGGFGKENNNKNQFYFSWKQFPFFILSIFFFQI